MDKCVATGIAVTSSHSGKQDTSNAPEVTPRMCMPQILAYTFTHTCTFADCGTIDDSITANIQVFVVHVLYTYFTLGVNLPI